MSILSLMEGRLPPGFRFYPKDEELVSHYLANKVAKEYGNYDSSKYDDDHQNLIMIEVDLNKIEPWDLPETARVGGKEWYFYSLRDRKYATGLRRNRATASGYWKATGKDRHVTNSTSGTVVGMRKTLVFYQGRAPRGQKTDWVMHEFRLENPIHPPNTTFKDWVLCRVLHKKRSTNPLKQWQDNSSDDSENSPPHPSLLLTADHDPNLEQIPVKNLDGVIAHHQIPNISNVMMQNMMSSSTDQPTIYSRIFPGSEHISMPSTALFPNYMELLGMGSLMQCPFGVEERSPSCVVLDQLKMSGSIGKMDVGLISRARGGSLDQSCLYDMGQTHIWNRY